MTARFFSIALLAFVALSVLPHDAARAEPPLDESGSLREYSGAIQIVDGFCLDVTDAAANVWTAAPAARFPTKMLGEIRYVRLTHADAAQSGTPFCFAVGTSYVGANTLGASVTCDAGTPTTMANPVYNLGQSESLLLDRTKQAGQTTGALPAIYVVAPTGETVRVCVGTGV